MNPVYLDRQRALCGRSVERATVIADRIGSIACACLILFKQLSDRANPDRLFSFSAVSH
jgi:hypothetical protein